MPFYINTQNQDSSREIARVLEKCIQRHKKDWSEIVFLCIGSDRVTGDCLGPGLSSEPVPDSTNFRLWNSESACSCRKSIPYNGQYCKCPSICPCDCH